MTKYHKINSIYKRDSSNKIMEGDYAVNELTILNNCPWLAKEKIDGTNIRIYYNGKDGTITFGGKTDNANIPKELLELLKSTTKIEKFKQVFGDKDVIIYGEGYGGKIQNGSPYIPKDTPIGFVAFDVFIGGLWLEEYNAKHIAIELGLDFVPSLYVINLKEALEIVANGFKSLFFDGKCLLEGFIVTPKIDLNDRRGNRIIAKIKTKDFLSS